MSYHHTVGFGKYLALGSKKLCELHGHQELIMELTWMFGILGLIFAGWILDVTASYRQTFISFGIAAAIVTILTPIAQRPLPTLD